MYDFEHEIPPTHPVAGVDATAHNPPSRLLTALELPRWMGEYAASRTFDAVAPTSDVGRARPVLVLPGSHRTESRRPPHCAGSPQLRTCPPITELF